MKKFWPLLAVAIILLTIVLAIWFDDFVDRVIVQPVAYLIFILQVVFGSFHQGVVWVSFILIALLTAMMILIPELSPPTKPKEPEWDYPNRIHIWERHIWAMNQGDYIRIGLDAHVADLILDALSYRGRIREDEVIKAFRRGELKVPPEVHHLIVAGFQPSLLDERKKYQYHPEEIVRFLEARIDLSYED
jgi:hypothetical protein